MKLPRITKPLAVICYTSLLFIIACSPRENKGPETTQFERGFDPRGYELNNFGSFTMYIPNSWKKNLVFGYDSQVNEYTASGDTIHMEFGYYTNPLSNGDWHKIGNNYAKIITPNHDNKLTGAYIPRILKINGRYCSFNIYGNNLTEQTHNETLNAISTVKFNNRYDLSLSR